MSNEPSTNTVLENVRILFELQSAFSPTPDNPTFSSFGTDDGLAHDFIAVDHRSGGVNFGRLDASQWPEYSDLAWQSGAGRPHWSIAEVIGVRGQRTAAFSLVLTYENGMVIESIGCIRVDADFRPDRWSQFDRDDRDAAIAELDRLHAEIDD